MILHWQISFLGSPKSVLIETSNSLDKSLSVSVLGMVSPFSQRDTACLVTIILSASSSCDIPLSVRSFKIIFFVSIIITSVIFIISINLQSEKQPAVAIIYLFPSNPDISQSFHLEIPPACSTDDHIQLLYNL